LSVSPYTFDLPSEPPAPPPDRVAELSALLADPQVGDVLELRYEDGRWTADVVVECPRCNEATDRGRWVEAIALADLLRELAMVIRERRLVLSTECPLEGHR
jgi:hypothetical protein